MIEGLVINREIENGTGKGVVKDSSVPIGLVS